MKGNEPVALKKMKGNEPMAFKPIETANGAHTIKEDLMVHRIKETRLKET